MSTILATQLQLSKLITKATATSRAGHLLTLKDVIGPPPPSRQWQDEWVPLRVEYLRLSGQADKANEAHVRKNDYLEKKAKQWEGDTTELVERGWSYQCAEAFTGVYVWATTAGAADHAQLLQPNRC